MKVKPSTARWIYHAFNAAGIFMVACLAAAWIVGNAAAINHITTVDRAEAETLGQIALLLLGNAVGVFVVAAIIASIISPDN